MVSSCKNSVKAFCANLVLHDRAIGDYQEFNKDLHKFRHLGEQYSEDNLCNYSANRKNKGSCALTCYTYIAYCANLLQEAH